MGYEPIGREELDDVSISGELIDEGGAASNCARQTGKLVAELEDSIVGDRVEEVLAIDDCLEACRISKNGSSARNAA